MGDPARIMHVQPPRPLRPVRADEADDGATAPEDLDLLLVERARTGDGAAWARLYQRHFDAAYRDVLFMVEQSATAEEVVQEAFAAALVSLNRFDGRSAFRTWLRGIAQNLVRKHWRSRERRGRAYDKVERDARTFGPRAVDDPEATHVRDRRAQVLSEILEMLPASLREVFVMRDVQGLEVDDVAGRLRISPGNVRVRANRARSRIRDELSRRGWLEGEGA